MSSKPQPASVQLPGAVSRSPRTYRAQVPQHALGRPKMHQVQPTSSSPLCLRLHHGTQGDAPRDTAPFPACLLRGRQFLCDRHGRPRTHRRWCCRLDRGAEEREDPRTMAPVQDPVTQPSPYLYAPSPTSALRKVPELLLRQHPSNPGSFRMQTDSAAQAPAPRYRSHGHCCCGSKGSCGSNPASISKVNSNYTAGQAAGEQNRTLTSLGKLQTA